MGYNINIFSTKADILAASFFPKTRVADLNDINTEATIEQRALNISPIILIEEISKLIKGLLNRKALGPDSIPNEVLKVVTLVIKKDLVEVTSHYFINGIALESLKESITAVLLSQSVYRTMH